MKTIKNWALFLAFCRRTILCDECEQPGAVPTLDKTFICSNCARLFEPR